MKDSITKCDPKHLPSALAALSLLDSEELYARWKALCAAWDSACPGFAVPDHSGSCLSPAGEGSRGLDRRLSVYSYVSQEMLGHADQSWLSQGARSKRERC